MDIIIISIFNEMKDQALGTPAVMLRAVAASRDRFTNPRWGGNDERVDAGKALYHAIIERMLEGWMWLLRRTVHQLLPLL